MKYNIAGVKTEVDFRSEEQLRALDLNQLRARLSDVSVTLARLRKAKKLGVGNPRVYHKAKVERKMIIMLINEKSPGRVD